MNDSPNIFISWSGPRSKHVATFLRDWLTIMLHHARPWMSEADIDKGSRGLDEIKNILNHVKLGIACLTPENLHSPWILYEAGALTKTVDDETRLCTYLLAGLRPDQIPPPLGMFQHTHAEKCDTRKLVHTINKIVGAPPLGESKLDLLFDRLWPDLEGALGSLPKPQEPIPLGRNLEDMIAEILDLARAAASASSRQEARWRLDDPRS